MEEHNQGISIGQRFLVLCGALLVLVAVVVLLMTGVFVYQLFYEPENIRLVQMLTEQVNISDRAFFGHAGGSDFYINMADEVRYFLYLFITVVVISILVRIFRGILSAGITLIKLANGHRSK